MGSSTPCPDNQILDPAGPSGCRRFCIISACQQSMNHGSNMLPTQHASTWQIISQLCSPDTGLANTSASRCSTIGHRRRRLDQTAVTARHGERGSRRFAHAQMLVLVLAKPLEGKSIVRLKPARPGRLSPTDAVDLTLLASRFSKRQRPLGQRRVKWWAARM